MRDCTGVTSNRMQLLWHTIGTRARRGWPYSRISVITTRFGGEFLRRGSGCVCEFDNDCSGTDVPQETEAPIVYGSLQEWHLDQVRDLLTRTFWSGIDSTSSAPPAPLHFNKKQSATHCFTNRNLQRLSQHTNGSLSGSRSSAHRGKRT